MSDISSVGAVDAAVGAIGSSGAQGSIAVSVLTSTEQMMQQTAAILMASLGLGQSVSTEA
jgi:hypothetical protein